jgi:hypothetical protein
LFCPECGKTLSEKSAEPKASEAVESLTSSPQPEEDQASDVAPGATLDMAPDETPDAEVDEPSSSAQPVIAETSAATVSPKDDEPVAAVHRRGEKTRERLHRASDIARGVGRGVIEEPAKRVEKIRHASNVVIEEASYDPSLRFVLVALGLFVLFIVLLVLSKVMG